MKLLVLAQTNGVGIQLKNGILDLGQALKDFPDEKIENDIMALIETGTDALVAYLKSLGDKTEKYLVGNDDVTYGPAVTRPRKIICVGLNYKKHADETKAPYPKTPIIFNKFDNALTGHEADVAVPRVTERLDYEVELGIVMGKTGKYISKADALDHVFGYVTANDLSARDIQKSSPQWMAGKTNDGFCPVGPYLVTRDEVQDPNQLQLTTKVNGVEYQNSNTSDMIFDCQTLIEYISSHMTLYPGDLILTGTPEGVILGRPMAERVYLQAGDVVTVEVENLGALTTHFISE